MPSGRVKGARTPGGDYARQLVGGQDLRHAADVRFPLLVVTLFSSDVAIHVGGATGEPPPPPTVADGSHPSGVVLTLTAMGDFDPCDAFSDMISSTVESILEAVHIPPPRVGATGISFLDDILQAGAELVVGFLNWAIGAGVSILVNGVRVLLKPVLDVIAKAAGILSIVAELVSVFRPWTIRFLTSEDPTRKGIDPEVVIDHVQAIVELRGLDQWPTQLQSCASLAGVTLPELKPIGAPVRWALSEDPVDADLATDIAHDDKISAGQAAGVADLTLQTGQESLDLVRSGFESPGQVIVGATITRTQLENFKRTVHQLAFGLLDGLPKFVRDLAEQYAGRPLDEFLDRLISFMDQHGETTVTVIYHIPKQKKPVPHQQSWLLVTPKENPNYIDIVARSCDGPFGDWSGWIVPQLGSGEPSNYGASIRFRFDPGTSLAHFTANVGPVDYTSPSGSTITDRYGYRVTLALVTLEDGTMAVHVHDLTHQVRDIVDPATGPTHVDTGWQPDAGMGDGATILLRASQPQLPPLVPPGQPGTDEAARNRRESAARSASLRCP